MLMAGAIDCTAIQCTMIYAVRGDAWPLLLSPCNTIQCLLVQYTMHAVQASGFSFHTKAFLSLHYQGRRWLG